MKNINKSNVDKWVPMGFVVSLIGMIVAIFLDSTTLAIVESALFLYFSWRIGK